MTVVQSVSRRLLKEIYFYLRICAAGLYRVSLRERSSLKLFYRRGTDHNVSISVILSSLAYRVEAYRHYHVMMIM